MKRIKLRSAVALSLSLLGMVCQTSAAHAAADVVIYDASILPEAPLTGKGVKVLVNGEKVRSRLGRLLLTDAARDASENLMITRDFFQARFNRDSWDNQGSEITAIVRAGIWPLDVTGMKQNAAWMSGFRLFVFGFGDGKGLNQFTSALDVIAHEFTHAVIESTARLQYKGQSGALNEHLADFFGESIQIMTGQSRPAETFIIGESTLSREIKEQVRRKENREVIGLRDMRNPHNGLESQPETVAEIPEKLGPSCRASSSNDNCGVHLLSGIPNRASVLIADGMGLEATTRIVYNAMVTQLKPTSDFRDYRAALKAECELEQRPDCQVIDRAFDQVGVY